MEEVWDRFEVNMDEFMGLIERKGFDFHYGSYEVWQNGVCIYRGNTKGVISAKVVNGLLDVVIDDMMINNYIIKHFSFGEISTINDRIMWSKDIFNSSGKTQYNNPDISSLFFKNGILSKVTYTIHDPNTLVEFYMN